MNNLRLQKEIVEYAHDLGFKTEDIALIAFIKGKQFGLGELSDYQLGEVLASVKSGRKPAEYMDAVFDSFCKCGGLQLRWTDLDEHRDDCIWKRYCETFHIQP